MISCSDTAGIAAEIFPETLKSLNISIWAGEGFKKY